MQIIYPKTYRGTKISSDNSFFYVTRGYANGGKDNVLSIDYSGGEVTYFLDESFKFQNTITDEEVWDILKEVDLDWEFIKGIITAREDRARRLGEEEAKNKMREALGL